MLTLNVSFVLENQTRRTFVTMKVPKLPCKTNKHQLLLITEI